MFVQPNFMFNGIRSEDMNVAIATFDNSFFNDIAIEYTSDISIENDLNDYQPYFTEAFSTPSEIELNLVVYDRIAMQPLDVDKIDMEELYDWLITDDFAPFISDDDLDLVYYFKVSRLRKVLTFGNKGYLRVTFQPFSKYVYRKREYELEVDGRDMIELFNYSRQKYCPMIEITNLGDTSTVNKINDMEIIGLETNEKIIIDNLTKLVQDENGVNKFACCNRKWITLPPRQDMTIVLNGNMRIRIVCEFPTLS